MIQKFHMTIDRKCEVWERQHITVYAETEERALELAKQEANEKSYCDSTPDGEGVCFDENEILFETMEEIAPADNDNQATVEIAMLDKATLWDNTPALPPTADTEPKVDAYYLRITNI